MKSFITILAFTFLSIILFCQSCKEKQEKFDFSCFVDAGMTDDNSKKFLTYINVHGGEYSGLEFVCDMYVKPIKPYMDSQTLDILFLIDAPANDSLRLKKYLKNWCFCNYIVTYNTPDFHFFKESRQYNIKGISYLFDKNGEVIDLTNPSMPNFHTLMKE